MSSIQLRDLRAVGLATFISLLSISPAQAQVAPLTPSVTQIQTVIDDAGRVAISSQGRLAYDHTAEDGYADLYVKDSVEPAAEARCLTCGMRAFSRHNGNPSWHPNGELIVFQSQDPKLSGVAGLGKMYSSPGSGVNNELWITNSAGSQFWRLTSLGKGGGVLHPHFSHSGNELVWAQRISNSPAFLGQWALKTAKFNFDGQTASISNVRTLRFGKLQMYESHGFSADDQKIIFTASSDDNFFNSDIYVYDRLTKKVKALTDKRAEEWDEHAHYVMNGEKIVWMSSKNIRQSKTWVFAPITDFWMMNANGSGKKRITLFNDRDSKHFENVVAADFSVAADGRTLYAFLINRSQRRNPGMGRIVAISLAE